MESMTTTIYDQQTGKHLTGEVKNITDLSFELWVEGERYVFSRDNLKTNNMENISKKSWNQFRETGLFAFINSILHAFGWVLVVEIDVDTKVVTACYPARTRFRGFSSEDQEEMHTRIANYLKDTAPELANEVSG